MNRRVCDNDDDGDMMGVVFFFSFLFIVSHDPYKQDSSTTQTSIAARGVSCPNSAERPGIICFISEIGPISYNDLWLSNKLANDPGTVS